MPFLLLILLLLLPPPALAQPTILSVPFTSEAPDGRWTAPWNNACEEASIVMAEQYYLGKSALSKQKAKSEMFRYVAIENRIFGYNANTDAGEMEKLINEYSTSFNAKVTDNPTIEQIKDELRAGRPVISLHYGYELHNPLIPFRRGGTYYHVMVIIGFDEEKKEFIVNDDGNERSGAKYRYSYETTMRSLHDYVHNTRKTNGTPRVLFTYPKFVKATGSNRVYRIQGNTKHYISNPRAFRNRRWKWEAVRTVDPTWLNSLETGEVISQ
ncbi:MAG: hypothetical protein UX39_C0012G0007 [Candidatus Magasanikbacteria bacterium GW2011_GWA2_46_17]|uniref:Peptidase C39-like domain-containing protein n=1 Tax=Candidatus Magasanikbacteria bacterium GW2011_GWA2_46_17 TaxID=1619042 RepID=A0A0G1RYX6_9BACT|nr:MAG: hypothetical protein UX39_C0012G0007 [Candidatus Magasanikbacteria bacterium GW2011_GWA2_46_17]